MKRIIIIILLPIFASSQTNWNMALLGSIDYLTTQGNDIWGWVDSSENEFALVGLRDGVSCVDVTDPYNPVEIFFIPDIYSIWRDIKTYGNYAYVTTESDAGLLIIDLTDMSGNTFWHVKDFMNPITGINLHWEAAHDLFIDENGICYIFGASNPNGFAAPPNGAIFLDVFTDPISPTHLGEWNDHYIHDGMVRGDTMYAGCIYDGSVHIVDVSDKTNSLTIGSAYTPDQFTHNAWVSDDGKYVFTTDEKPDAYLGAFDISDLNNIQEVDRIQSNPGSNSIPHNTFVDGNFLITSYYRDGTTVHDITHPNYMIQVAYYDSYSGSGNGFDGCWGTYPYFPSGNIISSDINSSNGNGQLLIYGRDFQQACYLQGQITDCITNLPISNVSIQVVNTNILGNSDLLGEYQTAVVDSGLYQIVYSAVGYENDTVLINLYSGVMTDLDVIMCPPCSVFNLTTTNNYTLCFGDSIVVGENIYTYPGNYIDIIPTSYGCDSIIYTSIVVNPIYTSVESVDICNGDVYTVGQNVYNSSGTYYDTLISDFMCDSIVVTELNVSNPIAILSANPPLLNMVANGGNPPYDYLLTGPNSFVSTYQSVTGSQTLTPPYNGQYSFLVTDSGGCQSMLETFSVNFHTGNQEFYNAKEILFITDILGRRLDYYSNYDIIFIHYSDGVVEKRSGSSNLLRDLDY